MQTQPAQAPGYELYLYRVTVPPGAEIAPHTHPGTQAASIEQGVLTYTLISGSADVTRVQADGQPGTTPETVTGPTTVKLRTGDSVVENPAAGPRGREQGEEAGRDPAVGAADGRGPALRARHRLNRYRCVRSTRISCSPHASMVLTPS